ncbi:hypothetical protein [Chryseobacterium sp. FH2]|uniref:hypothetical protein n=1 Tax=Chryseobacterium sp. FH2 TaxID=1674291 RepID=UPI000AD48F37|nr:hypothetical protein [Chryseobacterium sp. FH2]
MSFQLSHEEIRRYRAILLREEKPFKQKLNDFIEHSSYRELLNDKNRDMLKQYLNSHYIYFNNDRYLQNEVDTVFAVVNEYRALISKSYIDFKEELLDFQLKLEKVS